MTVLTKNYSAIDSVRLVCVGLCLAFIAFLFFPMLFFLNVNIATRQHAGVDHVHNVLFPEALRLEQWSENLSIQSVPQTHPHTWIPTLRFQTKY